MLEYFFKTAGQVNTKNNLFSVSPMDARFFFSAFSLYVIVSLAESGKMDYI